MSRPGWVPSRRRRIDAARVASGGALLVSAAAVARSGRVGPTERRAFQAVNEAGELHPAVLWPQQQFGNLAVGPIVATVALLRGNRRLAAASATATAAKLVLERAVKAVVVRHRPGTTVDGAVLRGNVPRTGPSFVSGHATMVTALATVVSPYTPGRWKALPWSAAALVCVARVYSGAHNPLDVIGGAGLGSAIGGATNLVYGVPRR